MTVQQLIINFLGLCVASAALLLSIYNFRATRESNRRAAWLALEKDRRDWIDKVIGAYKALDEPFFRSKEQDFRLEVSRICTRLSELADSGRLRFPNSGIEGASGGKRHPSLDVILNSHDRLSTWLMISKKEDTKQPSRDDFIIDLKAFLDIVAKETQIRTQLASVGRP